MWVLRCAWGAIKSVIGADMQPQRGLCGEYHTLHEVLSPNFNYCACSAPPDTLTRAQRQLATQGSARPI